MRLAFVLLLFLAAPACAQAQSPAPALPHHELRITLDPLQHSFAAEDIISLPENSQRSLEFTLHRGLSPSSPDAAITALDAQGLLLRYRAKLPPNRNRFTLRYGGQIFHPPQQDAREARSFENTPGIISPDGVFLSGASGWYPNFGDSMQSFILDVALPSGWHALSQGARREENAARVQWQESQPQDEIYLLAAPFTEYAQSRDGIEALVYLRQADAALAQRYLDATQRYIALYQKLIGAYPYAKFALVENFWESGYGMPSFTVLGSQVIRLPFIADSSYPHEILHNWWGNGVYVDYERGNWAEGLTAYLADHLLQEQKGNGAEHRRAALQKYADFVSAGRDFPLAEFRSRHSAQSEAVGYGKTMLLFHMLRRQLGDAAFTRALQDFYRNNRFKRASYADLEQTFSQAAGKGLQPFFTQWVQQAGAPQLRLVEAQAKRAGQGYELVIGVEQSAPAYALNVPLAVTLEGQDQAHQTTLELTGSKAELRIPLSAKPLRVDVDPEFDLFRRLDRAEIPPALSQVFGAEKLLIVLPRQAPEDLRAQYRAIAENWQKQPGRDTKIAWDDEIAQLPHDGAAWLFGWENRFRGEFQTALAESGATLSEQGAQFGNGESTQFERNKHALALTAHLQQTPAAWIAAPDAAMLTTLARKLPHYSKYSYAAFGGAEMTNLAKGAWPVTRSPLAVAVQQEDGSTVDVPRGKLAVRAALVAP